MIAFRLSTISALQVILASIVPGRVAVGQCLPGWAEGFDINGLNGTVYALEVFDDGTCPALYAGGDFTLAGGISANSIAKWDGSAWSPLAGGLSGAGFSPHVSALGVFDDGSGDGDALYVGGGFTAANAFPANRIARWDGTNWTVLGSGVVWNKSPELTAVLALAVFDDGSGEALYVGGLFDSAGGAPAPGIARWDGIAWAAVGSGVNGFVQALTVFDDGAGHALYAGGRFSTAGGIPANNIAKWNGLVWLPVSTGTDLDVYALQAFDDGLGSTLFVGGAFLTAGGITVNYVAKWNGLIWLPLNTGLNGFVNALTVYDDGAGNGPALYTGGNFSLADGVQANRIAKWNGQGWSALTTGANNSVEALAVFDDRVPGDPALFLGGDFTMVDTLPANRIARWACPTLPCPADIAPTCADGIVNVSDLLLVIQLWGPCPAQGPCPSDIAGPDQVVNVSDLLMVISAWGPCP